MDEFIKKYLGKKLDWDGFYGGQCVDLYRYYVHEVLGFPQSPGVGGAAEIWDSADPKYYDFIKNTPTGIPNKGDIIVWNRNVGGGFGHVAIFIEGDVNAFVSLDQNWPTLDKVTKTKHDYKNIIGWLRPHIGGSMDEAMEACQRDRKKFWEERDACLADKTKVEEELNKQKEATRDVEKRLSEADDEIKRLRAEMQKAKEDYKSKLNSLELQNKKEKERYVNFVGQMGTRLGSAHDEPEITAKLELLLAIEDQFAKLRSEHEKLQENYNLLEKTATNFKLECKGLLDSAYATEKSIVAQISALSREKAACELINEERDKTILTQNEKIEELESHIQNGTVEPEPPIVQKFVDFIKRLFKRG